MYLLIYNQLSILRITELRDTEKSVLLKKDNIEDIYKQINTYYF